MILNDKFFAEVSCLDISIAGRLGCRLLGRCMPLVVPLRTVPKMTCSGIDALLGIGPRALSTDGKIIWDINAYTLCCFIWILLMSIE